MALFHMNTVKVDVWATPNLCLSADKKIIAEKRRELRRIAEGAEARSAMSFSAILLLFSFFSA